MSRWVLIKLAEDGESKNCFLYVVEIKNITSLDFFLSFFQLWFMFLKNVYFFNN